MPAACWSSLREGLPQARRSRRLPSRRQRCFGSVAIRWSPSAVDSYSNRPDRRPRGSLPSRGSEAQDQRSDQRSDQRLDQRLDRWMSAGRQLVDGVSGARPGGRNGSRARDGRPSARAGFEGLGRWVEDRLDWLLEDEDDWREPWQSEQRPTLRPTTALNRESQPRRRQEMAPPAIRLPAVDAVSRADVAASAEAAPRAEAFAPARPRRALEALSRREAPPRTAGVEDWPDPEDFQVNRWQRPSSSLASPSQPSMRPAADPARFARRSAPIAPDPAPSSAPQPSADSGRGGGRPLPRSSRRRD